MACDIALHNQTHDFALRTADTGVVDLILVDDAERIAQQVVIALELHRGEWMFDTRAGVPYKEQIWRKNPNIQFIRSLLMQTMLAVEGVTRVTKLNTFYDAAGRKLTVDYTVTMADGTPVRGMKELGYE